MNMPQVYNPKTEVLEDVTQEWIATIEKTSTYGFKLRKIIAKIAKLNAVTDRELIDYLWKKLELDNGR